MEENKKGKVGEIAILIIVMIILGFVGGYFLRKEFDKNATSTSTCKTSVTASSNLKDIYSKYKKLSFVRTTYTSNLFLNVQITASPYSTKYVPDTLSVFSTDANGETAGKSYTVSGISKTSLKSVAMFNYGIDGQSDIAVLTKNGSLYLTVYNLNGTGDTYSIAFEKLATDKKIIDMAIEDNNLFVLTDDYKIYQIDKQDYSKMGTLGNSYEERETYFDRYTNFYYSINAKTGLVKSIFGGITYNDKKVYAKIMFSSLISYNSSIHNVIFITNDNDVIYFKDENNQINNNELKLQKYTTKKFKSIKSDDDNNDIIITYKDNSTEKFENITQSYNVD